MEPKSIGVLVVGYKRPESLRRCLSQLEEHFPLAGLNFFFALDGAKSDLDGPFVASCEAVFESFGESLSPQLRLFSTVNLGLKTRVSSSVSACFELVEWLIVLEDDCEVGSDTFSFFEQALSLLSHSSEIGAVSGSYFGPPCGQRIFLSRRFSSWGWATDKRTWQNFTASGALTMSSAELSNAMALLTKRAPLPELLEYSRLRKALPNLDSWAIPFDLFLREQHLLVLKPTTNQIRNTGFSEEATHTEVGLSSRVRTSGKSRALPLSPMGGIPSHLLSHLDASFRLLRLLVGFVKKTLF